MEQERVEACQQAVGYEFDNPFWLKKALTHSSNRGDLGLSNKRLEFLGDAVLGMVVSQYLFETYPDHTEGELTAIKSVVVSQRTLVRHSRELNLDLFLSVGRGMGEPQRLPRSVVANVFEALVGAIYLDRGLEEARQFVLSNLTADIEEAEESKHAENYKSLLQQLAQRDLGCTPNYRVMEEVGPDHAKSFRVVTIINDTEYGTGWGRNKKDAEQRSARESLAMLKAEAKARKAAARSHAAADQEPGPPA
jgi:ribonuclease-3